MILGLRLQTPVRSFSFASGQPSPGAVGTDLAAHIQTLELPMPRTNMLFLKPKLPTAFWCLNFPLTSCTMSKREMLLLALKLSNRVTRWLIHSFVYLGTLKVYVYLVTVRNEVANVMFLHVSVILSTGGLPQCMLRYHPPRSSPPRCRHPPQEQTPPEADTPPSRQPPPSRHPYQDGYCCGRYASYWNAFLCNRNLRRKSALS